MSIQTVGLPAGKVLTVTAGESDCTLFRILDTGLPGTPTDVSAGGTSAVGPFGESRTYGIDSITNQATYAITAADPQNATTLAGSFVEQASDNALDDGVDISVGTTTGSKIGTATGQKLAFHNSTPVIQRASAAQAAVAADAATDSSPFGYSEAQANAIVTLVNELRAALVEKGIIKGSA